jgi:tetratricopeptide (TPR) repeat protein
LSSKKSKLIESAQKNFLKGLYERAASEYRQIIQLDPADIRHRQRLAEILAKAEQKDEAIKEYTSLAKHYVDSVHYLKAIAVYKQIQKLDSSNPDISLTLASLNEKQGLIGNATAEYASAVHIYETAGENLKALKALEAMSALDPRNCAVRLRIAEKYFSTGREDQSADEFVAIARDLQERNDENGFLLIAEKIKLLFREKAAALFARIDADSEAGAQPAEEPPSSVAADDRQQPAAAPSPEEVQTAAEIVQPEPPAAAADDDDGELIEDILPCEDIEEIEDIEELEELEVLHTELADEDWEEEINFDELATADAVTTEPLPETDDDAPLEPGSELEDIELELEIDEQEHPDTSPEPATEVSPSWLQPGSQGSFDLGQELSVFADEIDFDFLQSEKGDAGFTLDSPSGFKKNELDNEDTESHYSLGLAYREMGLFDEAISEFIVASRSAERKIDCLILQGVCFRELGEVKKAVEFLTDILTQPELNEDEILGIQYELALCHEALGETMLAKQFYSKIMSVRADFSDTAIRLSQL